MSDKGGIERIYVRIFVKMALSLMKARFYECRYWCNVPCRFMSFFLGIPRLHTINVRDKIDFRQKLNKYWNKTYSHVTTNIWYYTMEWNLFHIMLHTSIYHMRIPHKQYSFLSFISRMMYKHYHWISSDFCDILWYLNEIIIFCDGAFFITYECCMSSR